MEENSKENSEISNSIEDKGENSQKSNGIADNEENSWEIRNSQGNDASSQDSINVLGNKELKGFEEAEDNDRTSKIVRNTKETQITISLNLDGKGQFKGTTGIGFFDHMLNLFAKHGLLDLSIEASGDLYIDSHHTIEDIGIVLGSCIKEALRDKAGIKRYGTSFLPMDETLAMVSLDLSGRAFLVFEAEFTVEKLGEFQTEMVEEFFRAVAVNAGITLHGKILYGKNNHHKVEALFKAFARALREAVTIDPRIEGVMSTKGVI